MGTNTDTNLLGAYLKDRRARLDPKAFGFQSSQRKTSGLRREEVAQLANISVTWYTWLEQGRGGAPSADVLDRIAHALALSAVEREHLFLLAQNRPPEVSYQPADGVTPRLQRVLDALEISPGVVRTSTWDIVAWNRAAAVVLFDYATLPVEQRNIVRLMFDPRIRGKMPHWEHDARFAVAAFRMDVARAGASERVKALIHELIATSPEFAAMWRDHDVSTYGEGTKHIDHPIAGPLAFEYSAFAVDGQPDLGVVVYNPATPADAERVRTLLRRLP
jgi:transcriptional regulator with XRE-family HTH domain